MNFLNGVCREHLVPRRPVAPSAPLSPAEQTAIEVARSWSRVVLAPPFQPPDDAPHVPSYADAASLDILRVWYPTPIGKILVAQTRALMGWGAELKQHWFRFCREAP